MTNNDNAGRPASKMSLFERWFDWFIRIINGIGSLWICCFLALICADILSRGLFNSPLPGVAEVVALSVVACFFLQMPNTLAAGRLNRVELLTNLVKRRSAKTSVLINLFTGILGMITFAALVHASFPTLTHSWANGEFIGVQGTSAVPTWPARFIVVIGSFLVFVKFLLIGLSDVTNLLSSDRKSLSSGTQS